MIVTAEITMSVDAKHHKVFSERDPRLLLAGHQVLTGRRGVTQVDLVHDTSFVVAMQDNPTEHPFPLASTTLLTEAVESADIRLVYAEDGGWKTQIVRLNFEVAAR